MFYLLFSVSLFVIWLYLQMMLEIIAYFVFKDKIVHVLSLVRTFVIHSSKFVNNF